MSRLYESKKLESKKLIFKFKIQVEEKKDRKSFYVNDSLGEQAWCVNI